MPIILASLRSCQSNHPRGHDSLTFLWQPVGGSVGKQLRDAFVTLNRQLPAFSTRQAPILLEQEGTMVLEPLLIDRVMNGCTGPDSKRSPDPLGEVTYPKLHTTTSRVFSHGISAQIINRSCTE